MYPFLFSLSCPFAPMKFAGTSFLVSISSSGAFPHATFPIFPLALLLVLSIAYLSTSRTLSSSFRVRSRGNSDNIRSRKGLLKPPFCPTFGWKLRRNLVRVFLKDYFVCNVSQDTSRCYENEIISPFNIVVHLKVHVSLKTLSFTRKNIFKIYNFSI